MLSLNTSELHVMHAIGLAIITAVAGWMFLPIFSGWTDSGGKTHPAQKAARGALVPAPGAQFYVAPGGTPEGDGSRERPWDLATALSQPAEIGPGASIWLRGGVYTGAFTSRLTGAAQAPITVRQYPGERAVIDGRGAANSALTVRGAWAVYWGFELMNSDPRRVFEDGGSHPKGRRKDGVTVLGPHTKLINLVIHDNANGIGFWTAAEDAEIYGCIIFNNGWLGPDRGHGHGIYAQNKTGAKRIVDVISFNNFGRGMEAYGTGAYAVNFHFEGNACFNNYAPAARGELKRHPNLFVGTVSTPADSITVIGNYLYHRPNTYLDLGGNLSLGFKAANNKNLVVKDNYVAGGSIALYLNQWESATVSGNAFYASTSGSSAPSLLTKIKLPTGVAPTAYSWNNNSYYDATKAVAKDETAFYFNSGPRRSFQAWQAATGFDNASKHVTGRPTGTRLFIRPNRYEKERTHLIVYNWDLKDTVEADLSAVLPRGAGYEIRNVQDYFGSPVLSGTYDGKPLRLPMTGLKVAPPIGYDFTPDSTAPEFGVFVLVNTGQVAPSTK